MRFRSSNPIYRRVINTSQTDLSNTVTYSGVGTKTFLLACIAAFSAVIVAVNFMTKSYVNPGLVIFASIFGFIAAMVGSINPRYSMVCSIVYALLEGVTLGLISAIYTIAFGDMLVPYALIMTIGVVLVMSMLYSSGIIKVTSLFRTIMFSALITLSLGSLVILLLSLFGVTLGIGIELYLIVGIISAVIAALYLAIDFQNISNCVYQGVAKEYEWALSLSLMITIVWLYVEILRIVAILTIKNDR